MLDNPNKGSLIAENLVLKRVGDLQMLVLICLGHQVTCRHLEEAEFVGNSIEMGGRVFKVDRLTCDWVFFALEANLKVVEFVFADDRGMLDGLAPVKFIDLNRFVAEEQNTILQARLRCALQGFDYSTF